MSNSTVISPTAVILNITSLTGTSFLILICVFMLGILTRPILRSNDVILLLVANNYFALVSFAIVSVSSNIDMVRGDYHLFMAEETLACRSRGYIMYSLMGVVFNTFVLQATFRFFRLVYPSHLWLQQRHTYMIIIPMMWIMAFLLVLPVHIWRDIQLIPLEHVCLLAIDSPRGFIWSTLAVYGAPMNIISIIYLKFLRFMHRSSIVTSIRAKRDVIVIRRIVLVLLVLLLIGIPSIVLELMLPFTNVGKPLFYRISDVTIIIAMIVLSLMLVYVTPQMKEILLRIGKQRRIAPTDLPPR